MADHVAADGYASAGYNFIIIDDCWLASTRDERGRLQPDHERFPKGIRALADYVRIFSRFILNLYKFYFSKTNTFS